MATTNGGRRLLLRRAGGPWGRARGLFAQPAPLELNSPPSALWLGRTPQVHTCGLGHRIAVLTASAIRPGSRRGRPAAVRVERVEVLEPGRLGRWSWPPPITLELHPVTAERLALSAGSMLEVEWAVPSGGRAR